MLTRSEHLRVLLAIGDLLARGLLVREADPERATLSIDGRGYRYHSRFWTLAGLGEADGARRLLRSQGTDAKRARSRVAREWIAAGAPNEWARMEAEGALMVLTVSADTAARA